MYRCKVKTESVFFSSTAGVYMRCAICKKYLEKGKLHYIVKINTFAAYDTLEINPDDLTKNYDTIIKKILTSLKKRSKKSLEQEVFKNFRFNLCKKCRNKYIKNPLGKLKR